MEIIPSRSQSESDGRNVLDERTADHPEQLARLLAAALRDTSESVLITDACLDLPGPNIVFCNAAFTQITGWGESEIVGRSSRILQGPLTDRSVMARLKADLQAGRRFEGETFNYRKDGTVYLMQLHISAVRDEAGRTTHYVAVQRDVTEERRTEREIQTARKSAEAAARAKSEFLAVMSHEIRTPMNGMLGMSSILAGTNLSPEQRDYLDTIRASGDSLLSILNDILDYSKIEAGGMELEALEFDLREMAEVAVDLVAAQGQDKGLELILDVAEELPWVRGDAGRIRQVLLNLLTNAIKFTQTGEVRLSIKIVERLDAAIAIRIAVSDTGIGISPQSQQRLFSPFIQADSSTTRRYGGTGLGLAISKRLIETMGGAIGLDSIQGEGSTFWLSLTLPVAAGEFDSADREPTADLLQGKRALVVDDNATNRRVLRRQLESAGLEMVEASSGDEALAMLTGFSNEGKPIDLALLDLHMPEMDGLMLARSIRGKTDWDKLPLVMLASHRDRESMLEARRADINEYLLKPVGSRKLLRILNGVLGRERSEGFGPLEATTEAYSGLVLVAEDNVVNQRIARMLLERLGLRVDTVANGQEAVAAHARSKYGLILMDCQMPEMDGWMATQRIREAEGGSDARTPIVALTAAVMTSDRERCLVAGMDGYLSKPIGFAELRETVGKWLRPAVELVELTLK